MGLKRTCESTEFLRLKFGGRKFQLQHEGEMALLKFSGFTPEMLACKKCGMIIFRVPESERSRD